MFTRAPGPAWSKGCVRPDPHEGHSARPDGCSPRGPAGPSAPFSSSSRVTPTAPRDEHNRTQLSGGPEEPANSEAGCGAARQGLGVRVDVSADPRVYSRMGIEARDRVERGGRPWLRRERLERDGSEPFPRVA